MAAATFSGSGSRTEGAKFWMKVFNDLKTRGVNDILIAVTDGLKVMPEALDAVFPATTLQTCIVHLIRNFTFCCGWCSCPHGQAGTPHNLSDSQAFRGNEVEVEVTKRFRCFRDALLAASRTYLIRKGGQPMPKVKASRAPSACNDNPHLFNKRVIMIQRTAHIATETDVPALTRILNDAVAYKLQHGDSAWGTKGWAEQGVLDSLRRNEVYVIEQDGLPAATMSLSWSDEKYWGIQEPNAGYVHRIAVRAGLHGLGLGGYAVDRSALRIKEKGLQFLRLDCDLRNAGLCHYYESLGFARVGTRPIPALGDYVASLYERTVP